MVEKLNDLIISTAIKEKRVASTEELKVTLTNYVQNYNWPIPQKALKHNEPNDVVNIWRKNLSDLFKK
jgi:hypothetical protein